MDQKATSGPGRSRRFQKTQFSDIGAPIASDSTPTGVSGETEASISMNWARLRCERFMELTKSGERFCTSHALAENHV